MHRLLKHLHIYLSIFHRMIGKKWYVSQHTCGPPTDGMTGQIIGPKSVVSTAGLPIESHSLRISIWRSLTLFMHCETESSLHTSNGCSVRLFPKVSPAASTSFSFFFRSLMVAMTGQKGRGTGSHESSSRVDDPRHMRRYKTVRR